MINIGTTTAAPTKITLSNWLADEKPVRHKWAIISHSRSKTLNGVQPKKLSKAPIIRENISNLIKTLPGESPKNDCNHFVI